MDPARPDLQDLEAFVHVVDAGSFTGAARAMNVPVSSVSRRLTRLEEQLGARLIHRTTRRLRLTEAGQTFHERVARSFAEIDEAQRDLLAQSGTPRGRVRITGPADLTILARAVTAFLEKHPDVQVDIDLSNRTVDLVAEGYDLAVRASDLGDSSLVAHKLIESPMRIYASPAYLERRGVPQSLEDLRSHVAIAFGRSAGYAVWNLREGREEVRVSVPARLAINHIPGLRVAALAGFGLVRLPSIAAAADVREGTLREVLPETASGSGGAFIVYPSKRLMSPAVRALVEHLREYFREACPEAWGDARHS